MAHDLVIRDGLLVDGTGAAPVRADVAVDGDRITQVGEVTDRGRREIDAAGLYVTPGFVDGHTHLDAQLYWEPTGSPSCWHGVTSVVLGNCGVTFAPVRAGDERYLAEMMESVEDIPSSAILSALPWTWETYGGYLADLGSRPLGVNTGGLVGHCALRYYAMGERSLDEQATEDDLAAMTALVREALRAGALGFSTSRTALHRVPDGRLVPGTNADPAELRAIGAVLAEEGRGVFEGVTRLHEEDGNSVDWTLDEIRLLGDIALATGRPVTFGLTQTRKVPDLHHQILDMVAGYRDRGARLRPQTTTKAIAWLYGIAHRTPFDRSPAWRELRALPEAERVARLRDPDSRARLIEGGDAFPPRVGADALFVLPAGDADYDLGPADSLTAHAARRGVGVTEAFIDLTLERIDAGSDLYLYWPVFNVDLPEVGGMLTNPSVVLGLADAGAHVGLIMDASQPTHLLTYWVREKGVLDLATAVRRLTFDIADLFGIRDRGVVRPGAFADLNVLDLDGLRLHAPEYVHDLPGGAGRYVQRASGYRHTFVNGVATVDGGELTGALPGQALR